MPKAKTLRTSLRKNKKFLLDEDGEDVLASLDGQKNNTNHALNDNMESAEYGELESNVKRPRVTATKSNVRTIYSGLLGGYVGSSFQKCFLSSEKALRCRSVPSFTLHGYRPLMCLSDARPALLVDRHDTLPPEPVVVLIPGSLSMLNLPTYKQLPDALYDEWRELPPPGSELESCPEWVPRTYLQGNRGQMDDLFALMAAPDVTRGRLSCVVITGPSGTGKTLGVISAAHAAKRHLIVVTATELPRPGPHNSALFRALDAALLPARGGAVLLRFAEALEGSYAAAVAAYLVCRVFATVQGHRLLFVTAPNTNNDLLRALFAIRSLTDSGAVRRLYLHAPTPEEAMLVVRQRSPAVERISDDEKTRARRLARECNGDMRKLSRWLSGCDLDFSGFSVVGTGLVNMDANPFVLIPRILGGVRGQITPAFTKSTQGTQRCNAISMLADVLAAHDTNGALDVLHENWLRVIHPQHVYNPKSMHMRVPAHWNGGAEDDLVFMADNLCDADLLSVWREGADNEEVSEERYLSAMVAVQACSCLSWSHFRVGAAHSQRLTFLTAQLDNLELIAQQRIEARLDIAAHSQRLTLLPAQLANLERFVQLNHHERFAQQRICKSLDMPISVSESDLESRQVTNLAISKSRDLACNRVISMRALTADQVLDWPVCQRD